MRPVINRIKQESQTLNTELRQRTIGFITAGLGLVAGLAWNDAIKALIEFLFPLGRNSVMAKFLYAVIISVVVVIFSVYLARILNRKVKE